jgi:hypothetical protein
MLDALQRRQAAARVDDLSSGGLQGSAARRSEGEQVAVLIARSWCAYARQNTRL